MATATAPLSMLDDVDLLSLLFARHEPAWSEFYRRYDRLVWRCITKVTTRFGRVLTAEDVRDVRANFVVCIMANDMRKLRMFDPAKGNRLGTWVGMLAINSAWDYLRVLSRQPQTDPLSVAEERIEPATDPFERAVHRESCDRVQRLLLRFSSRDRVFVSLYFVDGRSPEEVARRMGISVKTVYSKKHKIRTRLERLLEQGGEQLAA